MIFGFAFFVFGYAVFYWGIHHFGNLDCPEGPNKCRYGLWQVMGFGNVIPPSKPVQLQGG